MILRSGFRYAKPYTPRTSRMEQGNEDSQRENMYEGPAVEQTVAGQSCIPVQTEGRETVVTMSGETSQRRRNLRVRRWTRWKNC